MSDIAVSRPTDGVDLVVLDRPNRLNAMTAQMFDDLEHLGRDLARDDTARVVILTGAGRGSAPVTISTSPEI
ncbi:hypothetical protein GCM10025867_26030 [Frondihabitans sucicola]|uniref:Enoyl-CoA hydratase/isomerase domain-containing protein n=1 Tax=Frondihabitans sucicola TaxID=1268041 RepID=A0ABN6XZ89_9MICO|nr:enoyl-CoA hydratase/isomerase family protein [Frondihabitans sucicola]BDZ50362.1 hypothetical protein GCM10025867_26030 [Frondihabitans sucicola]